MARNRTWFKALRSVLEPAEQHIEETGETWADFGDSDVPLWRWGNTKAQELDGDDVRFLSILQDAVTSNGTSLAGDMRALCDEITTLPKTDRAWAEGLIKKAEARRGEVKQRAAVMAAVVVIFVYVDSDKFWHHVISGRMEAPRVDATTFDYAMLKKELSRILGQDIRVPDDLMDGVTIHMRHLGRCAGPPDGADFWRALHVQAENHHEDVIPMRSQWNGLHAPTLRNRSAAPPPQMFPVVLDATDGFELLMNIASLRMRLGIVDESGDCHMPAALRDFLTTTFKLPFKPFVNLLVVPNAPAKRFIELAKGNIERHF